MYNIRRGPKGRPIVSLHSAEWRFPQREGASPRPPHACTSPSAQPRKKWNRPDCASPHTCIARRACFALACEMQTWQHRGSCFSGCADGEGNEEAEDNMEEVRIPGTLAVRGTGHTQHPLRSARRRVQVDKNLDQMGTLITGLNSMAVVRALRLPFPSFPIAAMLCVLAPERTAAAHRTWASSWTRRAPRSRRLARRSTETPRSRSR